MARKFHQSTPVAELNFDPVMAAQAAMAAVDRPTSLALVLDIDGAKGALIAEMTIYPLGGQMFAKETVFWIDPAARGRWAIKMIREYEAWACGLGAKAIGLSCFADGRTQKLFERAGFVPVEVHTMKVN